MDTRGGSLVVNIPKSLRIVFQMSQVLDMSSFVLSTETPFPTLHP
jgi:hypothetical protein